MCVVSSVRRPNVRSFLPSLLAVTAVMPRFRFAPVPRAPSLAFHHRGVNLKQEVEMPFHLEFLTQGYFHEH